MTTIEELKAKVAALQQEGNGKSRPIPNEPEPPAPPPDEPPPEAELVPPVSDDPKIAFRVASLESSLLDAAGLDALPEPEWLIDNVLPKGALAVMYGRPGVGKSFVAMDIALCLATGTYWHGRPIQKGEVMYLAAEGATGLAQRKDAWLEANRIYSAGEIRWLPEAVSLLDKGEVAALEALAAKRRPVLTIIDTLARSMPGSNENAPEAMSSAVDAADRIRKASGGSVLLVHHMGRDGNHSRGHSSLDGAADTLIAVTADGPSTFIKCDKQKDAEAFGDVRLVRVPVADSCALMRPGEGESIDLSLGGQAEALLSLIRDCADSNGLSATELVRMAEASSATVYRAIKVLVSDGLVEKVGTDSRPRYRMPAT